MKQHTGTYCLAVTLKFEVKTLDQLGEYLAVGQVDVSMTNGIELRSMHRHISGKRAGDRICLVDKRCNVGKRHLRCRNLQLDGAGRSVSPLVQPGPQGEGD